MYKSSWLCAALAFLLLFAVCSSGCISELNPTPNEVKIRGNIISVDPNYISNDIIWMLLLKPNDYEPVLYEAIDKYMPNDNPVIEAGCGIGAVSAYINDKLIYPLDQVSIEPNPYLQPGLLKTLETNNLRCTFLEKAIAYGTDKIEMQVSNNILSNHVTAIPRENTVLVDTTTFEEVADNAGFSKKTNLTIIMTIVGSEHTVIQKESEFFKNRVDTVICGVYVDGKANPGTFTAQMQKAGFHEIFSAPDESSGFTVEVYVKDPSKYEDKPFDAGNEPVETPQETQTAALNVTSPVNETA
ncbi:MAG TPA: hypothetical protein O0X39_00885 [Methanocorpusculum sp.]|nr:hypothetical protein [Methanocorpusculum sp.]